MPYSICCFIKKRWIFFKNIGKFSIRSFIGTIIATRSLALHSFGVNQPPRSNWILNLASTTSSESFAKSTSSSPCRFGGDAGQNSKFSDLFVLNSNFEMLKNKRKQKSALKFRWIFRAIMALMVLTALYSSTFFRRLHKCGWKWRNE